MTNRSIDEDAKLQSGFQQEATEKIREFIRTTGSCADVQEHLLKDLTIFLGKVRDEDTLVRAASRLYIKKRLAYKEWAREWVHLSTLPLGKRRREAQQSVNMLCVKKDRLTLLFKALERIWPRFMEAAASRGELLLVEHYYH